MHTKNVRSLPYRRHWHGLDFLWSQGTSERNWSKTGEKINHLGVRTWLCLVKGTSMVLSFFIWASLTILMKEIQNQEQCLSTSSETKLFQHLVPCNFLLHNLWQEKRKPAKTSDQGRLVCCCCCFFFFFLLYVVIYKCLQTWNRAETKNENVKYNRSRCWFFKFAHRKIHNVLLG